MKGLFIIPFIVISMAVWSLLTSVVGFLAVVGLIALSVLLYIVKRTVKVDTLCVNTVPMEYYVAYAVYLKSPEWRVLRKLVLKRDGYKCVECGVKGFNENYNPKGPKLQVHHLHYTGIETMTFATKQCISVCKNCHDELHRR